MANLKYSDTDSSYKILIILLYGKWQSRQSLNKRSYSLQVLYSCSITISLLHRISEKQTILDIDKSRFPTEIFDVTRSYPLYQVFHKLLPSLKGMYQSSDVLILCM